MTPTVLNATPEAFSAGVGLLERLQPSLVTRQGGELTSRVWLNGKFRTKPWTQTVPGATQSSLDLIEDEVSDPESVCLTLNQRECSSVATRPLGSTVYETS